MKCIENYIEVKVQMMNSQSNDHPWDLKIVAVVDGRLFFKVEVTFSVKSSVWGPKRVAIEMWSLTQIWLLKNCKNFETIFFHKSSFLSSPVLIWPLKDFRTFIRLSISFFLAGANFPSANFLSLSISWLTKESPSDMIFFITFKKFHKKLELLLRFSKSIKE